MTYRYIIFIESVTGQPESTFKREYRYMYICRMYGLVQNNIWNNNTYKVNISKAIVHTV